MRRGSVLLQVLLLGVMTVRGVSSHADVPAEPSGGNSWPAVVAQAQSSPLIPAVGEEPYIPSTPAATAESNRSTPLGVSLGDPPSPEAPVSVRVLSLSQALDLAFEQNLSLEAARSSVEALSHLASLVRSGWLPRVVAYGVYIHNDHETVMDLSASMGPLIELFAQLGPLMESMGLEPITLSTEGEPIVVQHQEDYRGGGSISVEFQPQSIAQYQSAGLAYEQGETMLEQARLQIGLAVTELYYGLVTLQKLREVAERNVEMRRMSLAHVQARYDVGTVNQLDLLRAQMALDEATAQVDQLINSYTVLRTQTAALLQTEPDFSVELPADPERFDTPAEVWQVAESRHPHLIGTDIAWEIAHKALDEVYWSWAPILSAAFNVNAARETAMDDENLRWNITIQASWPLFLGGARFAQRGQRAAEEQAAYYQQLEARSSLRTQIETAFLQRDQLQLDLALARRQLETSREALDMARAVYEEGLGTQLDLIQAETMVFATEVEVTTTEISLSRQNAVIHSLTGQLWVP